MNHSCIEDIFARVKINPKDDYVIWGAGIIGERVLEKLKSRNITPLAFVDDINSDRWGEKISGIEIISLMKAMVTYPLATYILSSGFNHKIVPKVNGLKYIHYEELFYWGNGEKIKKAFNLLEDDESREEYLFRLDYLNNPEVKLNPEEERYCFKMRENEVIIDGGAYDGDTIRIFEKYNPSRIYAFEPDPKNFVDLFIKTGKFLNTERNNLNVVIHPYALYDKSVILEFNAKGNTYSTIGGSEHVYSITIDDMRFPLKITRIKLDIEGSEKEALLGAQKTMRKDRPVLAICAYHKIDDLWDIPLLINEIVPDYKIYLRRYDNKSWDGVCYGVPDESN